MKATTEIAVKNRLTELERVSRFITEFGQRQGLSTRTVGELDLAVSEIVTNIISYAYDDTHEHKIVVRLAVKANDVAVEIEDDGRPFDPVSVAAPPLDLPLEQRPVGGLGIHLVRKLTDAVAYQRLHDKNLLRLRKAASGPAASARSTHMEIGETKTDGIVILVLKGRLDAGTAPQLQQRLVSSIDAGGRRFVIDGRQLDYISSAGLQVLLVAAKRLRPFGGMLVVAELQDQVKDIFDIAGFSSIVSRYGSASEAVAALR
jgi:anti-anti-sigma factor